MADAALIVSLHVSIVLALIARVLLRPNRQPASRIAWVVVIVGLPVIGIVAYALFGEVSIGRRRIARLRGVMERLPAIATVVPEHAANARADVPDRYAHLFKLGHSISGFEPVGGNAARLLADSNAAIDAMVVDIDAATEHVHLLFYIWLGDDNGCKIAEALKRAASRGVVCRAMVDGLGSRSLLGSAHWQAMGEAGVELATALPIGNPLLRVIAGRIDLRNHRKILVIDDRITYCGSQNCADPEFRIKARFAPWVDVVARFEGPIVRQNQHLFAGDWLVEMAGRRAQVGEEVGEDRDAKGDSTDVDALLRRPREAPHPGFTAQVIGTGPTIRHSAMPELFEALIQAARRELVISTPYYVPDEALQNALCSAAYRGVATTVIFPARNDSWIVGAASRSYYDDLLAAGVAIHEYRGGLLHAKTLTLDGELSLIGSANMDRRSFDLNYENNILVYDEAFNAAVRARQQTYIAGSQPVTREAVAAWSLPRRLWNNALAMMGPIL
jgi:cardiolipin synthase